MQVQGTIKFIGQTEQISQSFSKRDIVVMTEESSQYPQPILVQFTQDKCDLLNIFQLGQQVTIDINLRGREYQDKQTGQPRWFNTIQGWKITGTQVQQQAPQQNFQQPQQNNFGGQPQQNFNQGQPQFNQPQQGFNNNNQQY